MVNQIIKRIVELRDVPCGMYASAAGIARGQPVTGTAIRDLLTIPTTPHKGKGFEKRLRPFCETNFQHFPQLWACPFLESRVKQAKVPMPT